MKFKRSLRFASARRNSPRTGNLPPATHAQPAGCLHLVFRAPPPVIGETVLRLALFAAVRRTAPEYATEIGLRALELVMPHLSEHLGIAALDRNAALPRRKAAPAPRQKRPLAA